MAEPVNGTVLAKAMRGAPDRSGYDYALELLGEAFTPAREFAQAMVGMVSPSPRSLGAAGVAGIRSMLPGSGTWQQEFDRYNLAAGPEDSVTNRVQAPGENVFDFARRYNSSTEGEREIMQAASMAAPIAYRNPGSQVFFHGGPQQVKAIDTSKLQARDSGDWGPGFYAATDRDLAQAYADHPNGLGAPRANGVVSEFTMPDSLLAHIPANKDGRLFQLDLSPEELESISRFHNGDFSPVLSGKSLSQINEWLRNTGRAQSMMAAGMDDVVVLDPAAAKFKGD